MTQVTFHGTEKSRRLQKTLYLAALASFAFPMVYLLVRMLSGGRNTAEMGYHSDADYLLMLCQCALGLVTIHLPMLLEKKFRFELPGLLYGGYIVFLYCAIFLGEVRSFFYLVPHWDVYLHCFSSVMTGFFGMMAVTILNRDRHVTMHLSPFFLALSAFSFSVMIGALWEVYEYVGDALLGVNMQKFIAADGTVLVGRAALSDTMKDIMVDMAGALLASVTGYFSAKRHDDWFVPVLTEGDDADESAQIRQRP